MWPKVILAWCQAVRLRSAAVTHQSTLAGTLDIVTFLPWVLLVGTDQQNRQVQELCNVDLYKQVQHRQQSVGWRSEPEASMPCSECLISKRASAITAAQPAAGVFPEWQLQGVSCASLWLRRGLRSPLEWHTQGEGAGVLLLLVRQLVWNQQLVSLPTRNQKVKWLSGQGKRMFVSYSGRSISHCNKAVINSEAGGSTPLRQECSQLQFTWDLQ